MPFAVTTPSRREPLLTVETLHLSLAALDLQEEALLAKIDELQVKRTEMDILSQLMHALALGKRSKEGLKIEDEATKKLVIYAHRLNPDTFDHFITQFPEGLLTQPLKPSDASFQGFIDAGLCGLTLSEVEIAPIPPDAIDILLRRLGNELDVKGSDVSSLTSKITMAYDNQKQLVEIMHDINEDSKRLIELMNSNTRK